MTYSNTKTNTKTKLFTMVVGANNEHYKTREKNTRTTMDKFLER